MEEIDGVLDLSGKVVPWLDWDVSIGHSKRANELILESLDDSFGHIDMVVMGFYKLEADILWGEVSLDYLCGLVVHHIWFWFVTFVDEVFKVLFIGVKDVGRR